VNGVRRVRVWDLPTRIFHWALVVLAVFSFVTGKIGGSWLEWHMRSGYTILALLLFRLAWGVFGTTTARFSHFVRGVGAARDYARKLVCARSSNAFGHNPLGGWMVLLMLAAFALQAFSGLFADDEISTQGPLAAKVSDAMVSRMSQLHDINGWVLLALAIVHVAAIGVYAGVFHSNLVRPMIDGTRALEPGAPEPPYRASSPWLALVLAGIAGAFVYWLVIVYPR
jgi:cytochrome b